ncbi:MAG: Vitamin B12 import ATP-binding protein BtuD [Phycisphaerae bacterium]|nr:Vitamin B12 import ATP-binding protein BtuD [Phycisphaerae bacterium]
MSNDVAIQVEEMWKKFTRGERNDSLRDALPALWRWWRRRKERPSDELEARQFWALSDVSFSVERGQALGIIGPNGAGKSTMLKLLSSILVPTRGRMQINGRLTALIEVGAGFHPDLTGRENIYLNGAILGMSRREITRKMGEIIDFAGVADFIDTPVKRYSSGMQARLGFSVAAHMDPEILLVDEVLAVGDVQFQQKCLDKMHYFANSGRAIVFISHNLQAVAELCPQALLLMRGAVAAYGPTGQVIQHYLLTMREQTIAAQDDRHQLCAIHLLNGGGEESNHFAAGEQARLTFNVQISEPPAEYLLGLAIRRTTDGVMMCDYHFNLPAELPIGQAIPMSLDFNTHFLTGSYAVTLFLMERASYRRLVYLDFVKIFDVRDTQAYEGLVHINPQLQISPIGLHAELPCIAEVS